MIRDMSQLIWEFPYHENFKQLPEQEPSQGLEVPGRTTWPERTEALNRAFLDGQISWQISWAGSLPK